MFATRNAARCSSGKLLTVVLLMAVLAIGLAACRGFFGQAPIALIVIGMGGDEEVPITVTFDLSGSNDPDGTIATYELDFGDGTAAATGTDVTIAVTHDYTTAGTYTVLLTVTDNDGRIGMVNGVVTIGPAMITFASDRVTSFDIFRMKADGSDEATVYNSAGTDELFPDLVRGTRGKIAYAAEDGTSWNIWSMTVTGGSRTQLTTGATSNQIQPSWSRTGATIAYASNGTVQTPSATSWEIFTMTASGSTPTQKTTQTPSWAIAPVYSPANDDFLFVSNKDATGGSSIWLWDDSAAAAVEWKDGPGRDGDVSPALAGLGVGLDLPAGAGISKPTWSPDGAYIAYAGEATAGGIVNIYVINEDGTNVGGAATTHTLEEFVDEIYGAADATVTTNDDEFAPFWLEDDSGIVFARDEGAGGLQLYKVTFATGAVTELTAAGDNVHPASIER